MESTPNHLLLFEAGMSTPELVREALKIYPIKDIRWCLSKGLHEAARRHYDTAPWYAAECALYSLDLDTGKTVNLDGVVIPVE